MADKATDEVPADLVPLRDGTRQKAPKGNHN